MKNTRKTIIKFVAIVTARLVLLDIVFQHLLCTAMPTTHSMSPVEEKHDYIRREILEILKRSIMPAAISLETITGARIYRFKKWLYKKPPYSGFPKIPNNVPCSLNQIRKCFNADCKTLGKFVTFINTEMTSSLSDIGIITKHVESIRQWMTCTDISIILKPRIQKKEKDYRIAKDIVIFVKELEIKYSII